MDLRLLTLVVLSLATGTATAQDKNKNKIGKITTADFAPSLYPIDSNANAVVLTDLGSSEFKGNRKGWFSIEFSFFRRARILNRKGYGIAEVEIPLYSEDELEEEVSQLKAVTYNLEDGKITETRLDPREGVFKTRINKNLVVKKFTFPNIKEGSIIEYEYKLTSDYLFNLQPWNFQGDYPVLWSEYKVKMPQFFYYVYLFQGYQPFAINEHKDRVVSYTVDDTRSMVQGKTQSFSAGQTEYRWAMKDVPALKQEMFTSSLRNHVSRIEFQLAEYRQPLVQTDIMGTWPGAAKRMLEYEEFGGALTKDNFFLDDVVKELGGYTGTDLDRAKKIFSWVRDNFTSNNRNSVYMDKSLRQVLKTKTGSEAEINLLLVALLRKAGLRADPVLLSTRGHGWAYPSYPMISRFNYVIAQFSDNGNKFYLDASERRMGFNRLGEQLYNGHARVMNEKADSLTLDADQVTETKITSVFLSNKPDGSLAGFSEKKPGYYESYALRERVAQSGNKGYLDALRKSYGMEADVSDLVIDSLEAYDHPVLVKHNFRLPSLDADIFYLNPMFGEGWKENPFKSTARNYPVEIPHLIDETFQLRLEIPAGYEVDELPRQLKVKLNPGEDGIFEYLVSADAGIVSLRSRLKLKRCYFFPDEYDSLREFFALVVKKHNEQFVFKKKK